MEEKTLDFGKMSSDDAFQDTIRENHGEALEYVKDHSHNFFNNAISSLSKWRIRQ